MSITIDGFRVNGGAEDNFYQSIEEDSGNRQGNKPPCWNNPWIKLVILAIVLTIVFFAGAAGGIAYANPHSAPLSPSPSFSSTPSMLPSPSPSPLVSHNWNAIASSADGSTLVAAESPGGIWVSEDSGVSWRSEKYLIRDFKSVASSADGTRLVAAVLFEDFGGPIYTYSLMDDDIWRCKGSINPWNSVASSADGQKLIAAASDQVYISVDFGATWTPQIENGVLNWNSVASSSDGRKLVAAAYDRIITSVNSGGNWSLSLHQGATSVASSSDGCTLIAASTNSIFTSTDSGASWNQRGETFYFDYEYINVASSANGSTFVAIIFSPNRNAGEMNVSVDTGKTWTECYPTATVGFFSAVALSADGSKIALTTYGGGIYTSEDLGATWKAIY